MIDHISLKVSDFQRSRAFYEAALAPLGYTQVFSNDQEQYAGFAGPDRERIWIGHREGASHGYAHIAILAKDRATVRKFYEAAMKAGGRDNGGRITVRRTTARSCSIPTVTISRRSATPRVNKNLLKLGAELALGGVSEPQEVFAALVTSGTSLWHRWSDGLGVASFRQLPITSRRKLGLLAVRHA